MLADVYVPSADIDRNSRSPDHYIHLVKMPWPGDISPASTITPPLSYAPAIDVNRWQVSMSPYHVVLGFRQGLQHDRLSPRRANNVPVRTKRNSHYPGHWSAPIKRRFSARLCKRAQGTKQPAECNEILLGMRGFVPRIGPDDITIGVQAPKFPTSLSPN